MAGLKLTLCLGVFFIILIQSGSSFVPLATEEACTVNVPPISRIILSLSSRLVKGINKHENFFFSPVSISAVLAMVYVGTNGTTEQEMSDALLYYFEGDRCLKTKLSQEFRKMFDFLENQNSPTLNFLVANGIFIHSDYTVLREYTNRLQTYFKASIDYVDFTGQSEQSLKTINEWISSATEGLIPKLLNDPLDPLTVLVLLNAVYFRGLWKYPFSTVHSFNGTFFGNKGTQNAYFMLVDGSFPYFQDPATDHHFVELPYSSGNISMVLMLPHGTRDFPDFVLTSDSLSRLLCDLEPTDATISLPKFKMEYRRELSRDVIGMGVNELFSDKADLSGIRKENDLHVSLILHKAVIEVDEQGTVAAGVGGAGIDSRKKPTEHISLTFDRPFLFYIINKDLNLILFAGRMLSL